MQPYVLIVEDEPGIVELLDYNLSAAGFETGVARDGDEAELALAERVPDAVLLDWMLPGVSGIELCRRIRRRPGTRDLPIIMLTARGEESDRIRGLDTGADDYVTKPFNNDQLVSKVTKQFVKQGILSRDEFNQMMKTTFRKWFPALNKFHNFFTYLVKFMHHSKW